jgi:hypothetical protein
VKKNITSQVHSPDLSSLSQVELSPRHALMFSAAQKTCGGNKTWRYRKLAEVRELLALAQISRLEVIGLDLAADLRVELHMRVVVPLMPGPGRDLRLGDAARLGVIYRQECLLLPQPGYSFVQILAPRLVWHPNVSPDLAQVLCLGPKLAAGIPLRELLLMTYGALTMQNTQLNPADSAGVLCPASADYFQRNLQLIPLSREPFLSTGDDNK